MNSKQDNKYLIEAIYEAVKAKDCQGRVGCIIVQDDKIISRAGSDCVTNQKEAMHAEYAALEKIGWLNYSKKRKNSAIYITLQPCLKRTSGKKGCAYHIIDSGIERVIFGAYDSNFAGQTLEIFTERGVDIKLIEDEGLQKICEDIFYDRDYNKSIEPYIPADAVAPEARPGVKAGNPTLDDNFETIRKEDYEKRHNLLEIIKKIGDSNK